MKQSCFNDILRYLPSIIYILIALDVRLRFCRKFIFRYGGCEFGALTTGSLVWLETVGYMKEATIALRSSIISSFCDRAPVHYLYFSAPCLVVSTAGRRIGTVPLGNEQSLIDTIQGCIEIPPWNDRCS